MYRSLAKDTNHYLYYKPDLHTIDKGTFNKAQGMGKKLASKKSKKRMALIGLWLHACQDRYVHGLKPENIKHTDKTDNYSYDYKGKYFINKKRSKQLVPEFKEVSKWKNNNRLSETVEITKSYLSGVKKKLNANKKGTVKKSKNIDKIVTDFFSK